MTRDRKSVEVEWAGVGFDVVDTGGWLVGGDSLEAKVSRQAEAALAAADVVVLVVDVTTGPVDEDDRAARWARRSGKPLVLAVNKVDDASREAHAWEFLSLGAGEPHPVSAPCTVAAPGDLLDEIAALLGRDAPSPEPEDGALRVAIVGRPNVGKSTLFNRLIGEERSVVHDLPGTTRDAIDTVVETEVGRRSASSTPPGCAGARAPSAAPRPTRCCAASRPSTAPTSRSWCSTRPTARRARTSDWPSASPRPAARRSSCSTSGSCSTPSGARR